jgi:hypothetical protein
MFLPVAVELWGVNAEIPVQAVALIAFGLVAWTAAAWGGLIGTLRRA